jgi:CheY-like chemotaxis protein
LSAISGSEQQATHNYAQIQVSDTGKGIGADFLPYIFERFRQADSKSNRSNKGLGLGLAIARHLVELQGGTIQAESPGIGQGATFTVKLPQTAVPSPQDSLASHPDQMQPPNVEEDAVPLDSHPKLKDLQVLVVDDEADTREWLSIVLQECGARVIAVGSVDEALEAIKQLKPNLLLSDIGMPGEDGYTLIRKVRELEPDMGGRIPAVALTAYASVKDYKEALSAGFQLHVAKPIRAAELVAVVASLAKMSGKL